MDLFIDASVKYKKFTGIGASGAWWAQYAGGWEETDPLSGISVRDRIAELLYSKENGIGMQIYRYNLGAGSTDSGKGVYSDPARSTHSLEKNGVIDDDADKNAVYMMKKCVQAGAAEVILFVNSPPERLTKNGKAQLDKHAYFRTNLAKKNYAAFADHCLDATAHFLEEGLPVKYISPVNEPLWIWNGGQEGCHYSPRQVAAIMKTFAKKMNVRRGLSGVKLSGAENGDVRWFNKAYTRAMLKYPEVRERIDGIDVHSYCLPSPLPRFFNDRTGYLKRFAKWMEKRHPATDVRMSEWCHMQGGKDTGMDSALEFMKVLCEDISILNVTSWQHWIACSMYDYCDGLIYIDPEKHTYELTKRYFATGNISKYLPENAVRIKADTDAPDVKVLCFTNDKETLTVLINFSANKKELILPENALISVTDESSSLSECRLNEGDMLIIPPRSVVSLIC